MSFVLVFFCIFDYLYWNFGFCPFLLFAFLIIYIETFGLRRLLCNKLKKWNNACYVLLQVLPLVPTQEIVPTARNSRILYKCPSRRPILLKLLAVDLQLCWKSTQRYLSRIISIIFFFVWKNSKINSLGIFQAYLSGTTLSDYFLTTKKNDLRCLVSRTF